MQLRKFRIKNYKSIKDSGDCYLSDDGITLLAGKNESGKSAILDALIYFHPNLEYPEIAIPIDESGTPEVKITFRIEDSRIDSLAEEAQVDFNDNFKNFLLKNDVSITKKYNKPMQIEKEVLESINHEVMKKTSEHFHNIESIFKELERIEPNFWNPNFGDRHDYDSTVWTIGFSALFHLLFHQYLSRTYKSVDKETSQKLKHLSEFLKSEMENFRVEDPNQLTERAISDSFIRNIPQIEPIIFSSNNELSISINKLDDSSFKPSFISVSQINSSKIQNETDILKIKNHLINKSEMLSKQLSEYWNQDDLALKYEIDKGIISLLISESQKPNLFTSNQRSDGYQYFLNTFLNLWNYRYVDCLFLIDEPDLHLHPKAQKSMLKLFDYMVNTGLGSQIIFSTHSPFLIESEKLHRVRLVKKDAQSGTKIENKYWKDCDNETLSPLLSAIGLELSQGLALAKEKNVLVEGQSDYFYLMAFKEIIKKRDLQDIDLHIIPCVGASKTELLASILIGWELDFLVLLDNDKKGNETRTRLIKNPIIEENQIILISEIPDTSIEDLFSRLDFCKFVLEKDESEIDEKPNSSLVKATGNHVLLAKKFLERVLTDESITGLLSNETSEAFDKVFDNLQKSFAK